MQFQLWTEPVNIGEKVLPPEMPSGDVVDCQDGGQDKDDGGEDAVASSKSVVHPEGATKVSMFLFARR